VPIKSVFQQSTLMLHRERSGSFYPAKNWHDQCPAWTSRGIWVGCCEPKSWIKLNRATALDEWRHLAA
jgi:hypothetical protein